MSSPSKQFEEATERHEHISGGGSRLVPLLSAIMAVLAAIGTLASHHRSIEAMMLKNDAILTTAKASEQYTTYQTKRVRVALYSTLLGADVITDAKARSSTQVSLAHEQASSLAVLQDAKKIEDRALQEQERSELMINSFVTMEIGTTLFEIALVLSSISALTRSPVLLWGAVGASALGIVLLCAGYFQGH